MTGLRIDPGQTLSTKDYFAKLQQRCADARDNCRKMGAPFISWGERSPATKHCRALAVHGTTGYREEPGWSRDSWRTLLPTGDHQNLPWRFHRSLVHFGHLVCTPEAPRRTTLMANDVNVLANMLDRLSEKNRWFRDFTLDALERAVHETIACFPVYRTYIAARQSSEADRSVVTASHRETATND